MSGRSNHLRDRKPQPVVLLWGCWVMLLVVLLSAAPTSAQPRTRIVGSAFDPSSISVAVSPKKLKLDVWSKKAREGRPGDGALEAAPELDPIAGSVIAASVIVGRVSASTADLLPGAANQFDLPARVPVCSTPARAPPLDRSDSA